MTEALRIGITVDEARGAELSPDGPTSRYARCLAQALALASRVRSVQLVNTSKHPWSTARLQDDAADWPLATFDGVKDDLDVLIELGSPVSREQTTYLKSRGARLVSYCCDSAYMTAAQSVLFGQPAFGSNLFVNPRYDAIWMNPRAGTLGEGYWTTIYRRVPQLVPFVWRPRLAGESDYRPRPGARRVTVFGPNAGVQKFCLYPALIVEMAHRQAPEFLSFLHVTDAEDLATKSREFVALMSQLDIVKQHKASFVKPFPALQFLAEMTDVVVSHGWEVPVDALHLDICWQGYPLVHNDALCSDLGYYYPDNDIDEGSRQLLRAMREHDATWSTYASRQREHLTRYLPASVAGQYDELLGQLMARAPV